MVQDMVLVLLVQDDCLYLGIKHLKIGAGKLNAPGGKIDPEDGGDPKKAAVRETYQEAGVIVDASDLKQVASLKISREGIGLEFDVTVFMTKRFSLSELKESAEISRLEVHRFGSIDYRKMMPADRYWLPLVLFGQLLEVSFNYNHDRSKVLGDVMLRRVEAF